MDSKQIALVKDAYIGVSSKNSRGKRIGYSGVHIAFVVDDTIQNDTLLSVENHWFKVHSISINAENQLEVEAHEVGYYARKFDEQKGFDLRSLMNSEVNEVLDQETKSKVSEESCWC